MKTLKKTFNISDKKEYFKSVLKAYNIILGESSAVTDKEIELISTVLCFEGALSKSPFGKVGRAKIREELNICQSGLSRLLKKLEEKGFIKTNEVDELELTEICNISSEQSVIYNFKYEDK